MEELYGDAYRAFSLLLHGADPFTPKIDERKYELLLERTHLAITKNLEQHNWRDKLIPFSGPQCHEDRGNKAIYYNPNMTQIYDYNIFGTI